MNKKIILKCTLKIIMPLILTVVPLLFSETTKALSITTSVVPSSVLRGRGNNRCQINYQTVTATSGGECYYTKVQGDYTIISRVYNNTPINIKKGDIFEFFIAYKQVQGYSDVVWTIGTEDYFTVVDWEKVSSDRYLDFCYRYEDIQGPQGQQCNISYLQPWSNFYKVTMIASEDRNNVQVGLGFNNTTLAIQETDVNLWLSDIVIYNQTDIINNAEQQTQEASDEGQQNADQADTENEQASQNVISLVGNIVNVFYTPAGDCTLDIDLGNIDLGNINLCSGKPTEFEQIINLAGSILIVYACYRVARTIFRLWVAMSIFGQGGNTKGDK